MSVRPLTCAAILAAALLAATGAARGAGGGQPDAHAGHAMTHEQIEILKSKIEIYRPYTDEQINAAMARMYDAQDYLSPAGVRGEIGLLALGHGYKEQGDALFKQGYAGVASVYPTAVGLGMTMMSSAHIQQAVDQLQAAGAKTIVVLPTEIGENTSLIRQWQYAFGLRDTSSYLDVERIRSDARIVLARTPTASPLLAQILADYVKGASRKPAAETVVLIAHGPEDDADNEKELANLAAQAAAVKSATGVAEVRYGTLQDDAPPEVRQRNVNRIRAWIQEAEQAGRAVIVVPVVIVSRSGVSNRIERDLAGLAYTSTVKGIAEHPLFERWVRDTVAAAVPGDDLSQLTPEQAAAARKMLRFMEEVEQEFFARVKSFNGRLDVEPVTVDPGNARYEIRTTRGPVLEKAAVMTAITRAEQPPFVRGGRWNRFFEVAVHPKSPRIGMLHATFVVQVALDGSSTIAGTIDMMKAAQEPEDLTWFRAQRDAVFARHGVDPARYVVGGCGKPNEGGWKWHRPSTCTGASIFGANLQVNEQNFDFVADVFRTGMRDYFELVDKRRRARYGSEELAAQAFMRRRWLEDQLFWDVLSKNFVPYEAWSAVNAPPAVAF